ncbi:hypothetical protein F5B19DRAFT_119189 [Rostrohypoxylon terebratum]|nr:hypothetical protein F5B19DRAFT_119189 [Rostrohypoxylon terebratum]
MSGRVRKSVLRPNQRLERDSCARYIETHGLPVFLCSNCTERGEDDCFLASGYVSCNHCTRSHRKGCDVVEMNSIDRVSKARSRLEQERRDAEDELLRLQTKVSENINKLQRLRRQEELLKKRGLELLKKGDDLDAAEEKEERERFEREEGETQRKELEAQRLNASVAAPSFFGVGFGLGPMSPSTEAFLASVGQGSGDGSPQADPSNASHV